MNETICRVIRRSSFIRCFLPLFAKSLNRSNICRTTNSSNWIGDDRARGPIPRAARLDTQRLCNGYASQNADTLCLHIGVVLVEPRDEHEQPRSCRNKRER